MPRVSFGKLQIPIKQRPQQSRFNYGPVRWTRINQDINVTSHCLHINEDLTNVQRASSISLIRFSPFCLYYILHVKPAISTVFPNYDELISGPIRVCNTLHFFDDKIGRVSFPKFRVFNCARNLHHLCEWRVLERVRFSNEKKQDR